MASMDGVRSLMILLILGAAFSALNSVIAELDWRTCGNSLPKACGVAIGQRVNLKKGPVDPLADDCCVALVKIGKDCHDAFTREHIRSHKYEGRTYLEIKKSEQIWNDCVEVVKFLFPPTEAPSSS